MASRPKHTGRRGIASMACSLGRAEVSTRPTEFLPCRLQAGIQAAAEIGEMAGGNGVPRIDQRQVAAPAGREIDRAVRPLPLNSAGEAGLNHFQEWRRHRPELQSDPLQHGRPPASRTKPRWRIQLARILHPTWRPERRQAGGDRHQQADHHQLRRENHRNRSVASPSAHCRRTARSGSATAPNRTAGGETDEQRRQHEERCAQRIGGNREAVPARQHQNQEGIDALRLQNVNLAGRAQACQDSVSTAAPRCSQAGSEADRHRRAPRARTVTSAGADLLLLAGDARRNKAPDRTMPGPIEGARRPPGQKVPPAKGVPQGCDKFPIIVPCSGAAVGRNGLRCTMPVEAATQRQRQTGPAGRTERPS